LTQQPDLDAVARAILAADHYMTLGTADPTAVPDQRTPVNP
jgi:hypothetical protein